MSPRVSRRKFFSVIAGFVAALIGRRATTTTLGTAPTTAPTSIDISKRLSHGTWREQPVPHFGFYDLKFHRHAFTLIVPPLEPES